MTKTRISKREDGVAPLAFERTIALYNRVSSPGQAEEGASLDAQEEALRELAGHLYPGVPVVVYTDAGKSARKDKKRPGFKSMCEAVERGDHRAVLAPKPDRLARSVTVYLELIKLCADHDTELHTKSAGKVETSAIGKLVAGLLGLIAEFESDLRGERVREVYAYLHENGQHRGGKLSLGFDRDERTRKLHANDAAWIVCRAFEMFDDEGASLTDVARFLAEARGVPWRHNRQLQYARRLLSNRHYVGDLERNGEWITDAHEALIDRDTFRRVQLRLASNKAEASRPARSNSWGDLGRCGYCGWKLSWKPRRKPSGKTYTYWVCDNRECEERPSVRAAIFDCATVSAIDALRVELALHLEDPDFALLRPNESEAKRLEEERDQLTTSIQALVGLVSSLQTTPEDVQHELDQLIDRRDRVTQALERASGDVAAFRNRLEDVLVRLPLEAATLDHGVQADDFEPPDRVPTDAPLRHWWSSSEAADRRVHAARVLDRIELFHDRVMLDFRAGISFGQELLSPTSKLAFSLEQTFGFGTTSATEIVPVFPSPRLSYALPWR